jgi:CRP/FNR family transcriptional regulator
MRTKVKNILLFNNLCDETIAQIQKFTYECELKKNNILFYEGDESKYLYIVTLGIVKLFKTSSQNRKIILKYFHPEELIGEVANFENLPYPATAQAFTDIEFLKIDFSKLREIIYKDPELSLKIQASLINKIKALENVISSDLVLNAKERLARYIYQQKESFFYQKNIEIAEILNITPETLSRILKSFKSDGLINLKDKTIDMEKLNNYF